MTRTWLGRSLRRVLTIGALVVIALVSAAGTLRAFVVAGPSDAPTLRWGDLVLVNLAAYHIHIPFTYHRVVTWSAPERGDMTLFRVPNRPGMIGLKRVVAIPGDIVETRAHALIVNGQPMTYAIEAAFPRTSIPPRNELGDSVAVESGVGMSHRIGYTPVEPVMVTGPLRVPENTVFLLGDNRDHSNDSRTFGVVPREQILGKLVLVLRRSTN